MNGRIYASIALGDATLTGVMSGWLLYFYLPPGRPALVPLGLFGLAILVSRVIHLPLSLWIDGLVRRTHSRWGAQLPYVVAGGLGMPVLFGLLWLPPGANDTGANLVFVTLVLIGFNLASGIHQTAYEALGSGLGEQGQTAANWRMVFMVCGSLLAGLAGPLIAWLGYTRTMEWFAVFSAAFLILPGLALARQTRQTPAAAAGIPLADQIRSAWSGPAFRVFALAWGLMWLATTFTFETLPYIVTEICKANLADSLYFYLAALVVPLVAYPLVMWLTRRYGAGRVFRGSLLAGALAMPALGLIGTGLPGPLLAQGLVWIALQAGSLAGALALPGAIAAASGAGEQSKFGNLVDQVASGLALAIIPLFLLLGRSQSDSQGPLGVRLLGLAGGGFLLAAFVAFGRFRAENYPHLS